MGRSRKRVAARKREAERTRAEALGLAPLAGPSLREGQTGDRSRPPPSERGADKQTLAARAKAIGAKDTDGARAQSLDGPMGRALHVACPAEVAQLWPVWCRYRSARLTYRTRVLSLSTHAKGALLPVLPGKEPPPPLKGRTDARTEEERAASADRAWDWWAGKLRLLAPEDRDLLRDAVAEADDLVRLDITEAVVPIRRRLDGPSIPAKTVPKLTAKGEATVAALKRLAAVAM